MTRIIKDTEAHYETHEVPFGRVYEWHPEHIIVECDCGERFTFTAASTTGTCCRCDADHSAVIREIQEREGRLPDTSIHPWHHDAQEQEKPHRQDEAAYPEDSPWRYNDVTAALGDDEERWKKA